MWIVSNSTWQIIDYNLRHLPATYDQSYLWTVYLLPILLGPVFTVILYCINFDFWISMTLILIYQTSLALTAIGGPK